MAYTEQWFEAYLPGGKVLRRRIRFGTKDPDVPALTSEDVLDVHDALETHSCLPADVLAHG